MTLKNPFSRLWNQYQDSKGEPASVMQWAATLAPDQKRLDLQLTAESIRAGAVVRWADFGKDTREPVFRPRHILQGWGKDHDGRYMGVSQYSPELAEWLVETTRSWSGDIQDIKGLTSSKSDLDQFTTLEDFAKQQCADLMASPSVETMQANLDWRELSLDKAEFTRDDWDGRLFLNNQGGSHHFAAGQQLAAQLGCPVPVVGQLRIRRLNPDSIAGLREKYEIFMLSNDPQIQNGFLDAMTKVGASYFSLPMPTSSAGPASAILLPRNDAASMRVANVLRQEGFVDVGLTLEALSQGHHRHALSQMPRPSIRPATLGAAALLNRGPVPAFAHDRPSQSGSPAPRRSAHLR